MKRSALAALAVSVAALLVGGCGGGSNGGSNSTAPKKATAPNVPAGSKVASCGGASRLRATAVDCDTARRTMERWERSQACTPAEGVSRSSCSLGSFRCQAVKVDEGTSVSCVGPEGDVAFIVRPSG
ncbi:MAG TPA: hypothetical protein VN522_05315 [Solirubrobacterales bacterium]|nr:hypothetical protein [Solirubrobacterales bacterium]